MFNCRVKASRLFSQSGTLLGLAGLALLTLCAVPKASAVTYHYASTGYCQIDPDNPNADVQWNFVLNPNLYNPSTLVGTSNYNYEFAVGECFWSGFGTGTVSGTVHLSYQTIYNTGDTGANPAGAARIYVGTSSSPGQ